MTEKDKAAQRSTTIFQLGKLLAPLFEVAEKTPPPAAEYQIVTARCMPDKDRWCAEVEQFVSFGDYRLGHLGNDSTREPHNLLHEMPGMARSIADDAARQSNFRTRLTSCRDQALAAIDLMPIEWTARLHEAQTPFSVYLKFRDAIGTAKRHVNYFDRYFDTEFFLGTSIKDAGTRPTNFSPADSTAAGHAVLDVIMAKGTVIT